jgi:hypothetical protein
MVIVFCKACGGLYGCERELPMRNGIVKKTCERCQEQYIETGCLPLKMLERGCINIKTEGECIICANKNGYTDDDL